MADQQLTLVGNLTRDFELRYTTSGRAVASGGIAVARRYQQNGEWQETTAFFQLVCWGDIGENAAASLNKGNRVIATGRIEQRDYDDKEGNKRTAFEVIVDEIGPSLRWAQAQVERISRDDTPPKESSRQSDPVYGDEEPF